MKDTLKQISDSFDFIKPMGATVTSISLFADTHIILQDLAIILSIAYTIFKLFKLHKPNEE